MSQQTKLIFSVVVLVIALGAIAYTVWPARPVGSGKPAQIIHPLTRERYDTTWDKIFTDPAFDSKQDKSTNGGWMAIYPGTDYYGYVVHKGQHHPSEDGPPPAHPPKRLKPGEVPP